VSEQQTFTSQEFYTKLFALSFIKQTETGDAFVLHDEMRRLVVKYCWDVLDPERLLRQEISSSVKTYFENRLHEDLDQQQRQRYLLRVIYHHLYFDPIKGIPAFRKQVNTALSFAETAFARLLLQEAQSLFELFSADQQFEVLMAEVKILRQERELFAALSLLERLHNSATSSWLTTNQLELLIEEARVYRHQGRLQEAEVCFSRALDLAQESHNEEFSVYLLTSLGLIARQRGDLTTALRNYEESMRVNLRLKNERSYLQNLLNSANVYRRLGDFEEALKRAKVVYQLRLVAFHAGVTSELLVGKALYALGQICHDRGDIVDAERYYDKTYAIYQRINNKSDLAMIYNRFGALQTSKGNFSSAREWLIKGQLISQNVNPEQTIYSVSRQGRIFLELHQWLEAVPYFQQAITQAHSLPDHFQEAENLIDLAITRLHLNQAAEAQEVLNQAETLATKDGYHRLLALIEQQRAEICYKSLDYQPAFRHFATYCHHMLLYNDVEFTSAIQVVVDALLGIPHETIPTIIDDLRAYQAEHRLDESFNRLLQSCTQVAEIMVLWRK
jgi:tetratricopeptide (TPR) repeat protein